MAITLTTGIDAFTGTAGNDTFVVVNDAAGTGDIALSVGDEINGAGGTDTLKITVNDTALDLGVVDIFDVENVTVKNVNTGLDDIDFGSGDFTSVTITGMNDTATSTVTGIKSSTEVTFSANKADGADTDFTFDVDSTSTDVTIVNTHLGTGAGSEYNYSYFTHDLSAVTTLDATLNLQDSNGDAVGYSWTELDITLGEDDVVVNLAVNVDGATSDTTDYSGAEVYIDNDGGSSVMTLDLSITNSDTVYVDVYPDNGADGSSADDVANIYLNALTDSYGYNYLQIDDVETFNVTVGADGAELYEFYTYGYGTTDFTDAGQAFNIVAEGDFIITDDFDSADEGDVVITVSGAGNVDFSAGWNGSAGTDTIDASDLTGDLAVYLSYVTDLTFTSGSGDDTLLLGGYTTEITAADGGGGTDTIGIDDGADLAAVGAVIENFEVLDINGGTGTYDLTDYAFESVISSGALAGDVVIDMITDEEITVGVTTGAFSVQFLLDDDSGTSDTLTINLSGAAAVTATELITTGIETLTLTSNTKANTVTLLDSSATTLIVSGAKGLTITAAENNGADGDGGGLNTTIETINASALGGSFVMTEAFDTALTSVFGSTSADTLKVSDMGSTINGDNGGDSITISAAGGVDTLIVNAGASKIGYTDTDESEAYTAVADGETFDIVTGFTTGEDVIDLGSFSFIGSKASAIAGPTLTEANALKLVNGTTTSVASFFIDTGVTRGVAAVTGDFSDIGGSGTNDTLVFIDTNGNGNLDVASDDMIMLVGAGPVTLSDFGF